MKFTKRQQERIEHIIQEEMKTMKEGWTLADAFKRSSLLTERNLFEAAPLEQDLSENSIFNAMEQVSMDEAQSCLMSFDNELLAHVASILKSHGILDSSADAGTVYEMLANHAEAPMIDAQMECASDISMALEKYAKEIAALASSAVGPQG